jgi:hypothetical protein
MSLPYEFLSDSPPRPGLGVGFGVGYLYRHRIGSQHKTSAEQQAVEILRRAEQAHAQNSSKSPKA